MKEPNYVMKLMTPYGTLEPTDKRASRKFKHVGVMGRKEFLYKYVVANNFCINIKLMTTTTGGMHPSPLRKLGMPNIGLISSLLGTLPSQK